MPSWRDDKILELANQLTYSPADKRREQLHAAIDLVAAIDPAKTYPWDFVHFRITSFQPRGHIDHIVPGAVLRADLATLVEFLSDTLSIKVEDAGDSVLLLEDVTRKFNVSSKTIQRWRKQGLIALRYVYPDGRRRLGFLDTAVSGFAAANKERVERSATFKQLSDEEKRHILALARALIARASGSPVCIKEVSRQIAHLLKRAPETIRYTLRRHDQEHPEAPLFPETDDGRPARQPEAAAKPDPAQLLLPLGQGNAEAEQPVDTLRDRALALKRQPIEFMSNPLFDHPDADTIILKVLPAEALARAQQTVSAGINAKSADVYVTREPRDLPPFLQQVFRQPVMPQELETDAFRRMNYLKHKAARLQSALNVDTASSADLDAIESLLAQARELKNQIVQGNLRIAVHVARKHQRIDRPLAELVSDANIWLMRAAEKYDFARPVRFSTYAGYSIMKNFARDRAEQLTRRDSTMLTGQEEVLSTLGSPEHDNAERLDTAAMQVALHSVIDELPERERELVTSHYGLGQQPLSLAEIGDKMGITKARVQQLEARALRKLRLLLEARREKLHQATTRNPLPRKQP